jgi:ATP-dependent Lon protease
MGRFGQFHKYNNFFLFKKKLFKVMARKGKEKKMKRAPLHSRPSSPENSTESSHSYNTRGKRIKITESILEMLKESSDNYQSEPESEVEPEPDSDDNFIVDDSDEEDGSDSELDYFEYDFDKIKGSIVKYIESEGFSRRKMKKVKKAVDKVFDMFCDAKKEAMHEIADAQPTKNLWKLGLGPEEIDRLEPILKKLREDIKEETTISITEILDSPLSDESKKAALQMFDIIQNLEPYTTERLHIIKELKHLINIETEAANQMKDNENYQEVEKELSELIGKNLSLRNRILSLDIDKKKKSVIWDKYLQLEKLTDQSDTTASSLRDWLEHALKIPFNKIKKSRLEDLHVESALVEIKKGLDEKLFGMSEVKEQILCIFNNRLKNKNVSGMKMAMLGSPGVGKTQIARCLADILDLPFVQISLGGMVDSTILAGSNQTWVGGGPGRIVKALQTMGVRNGIVFLDEIDKLTKTPAGKEVQSSLLHVLDPTQNIEFKDNYLGHDLPMDLSNIFFITAANDVNALDPALLSRIPPIKIPDYSSSDKKKIVTEFIIPKLLKKAAIEPEEIIFPEETIRYLLSKMEKSGGIRNEEDAFGTVIYRLGLLLTLPFEQQKDISLSFAKRIEKPVTVTNELIDLLYKKKKDDVPLGMYM